MANDWFSFKRFTVRQVSAAMKVGTDGTLLGAWTRVDGNHKRILDIGTGTGLIALMLAQRTETFGTFIEAIDIDPAASNQAAENFISSPWSDRLRSTHISLNNFADNGGVFDHIVSNPPYFVDSLTSPDKGRTTARHASSLPYSELTRYSAKMLNPGGTLSVIIPNENRKHFTLEAEISGLHPTRITFVQTLPGIPPRRVLLELVKGSKTSPIVTDTLLIEHSPGGNYTDDYRELTKEFYLKF